ncbi:MAG: hypothetical protein QM820_18815 [Minicystis sp.]
MMAALAAGALVDAGCAVGMTPAFSGSAAGGRSTRERARFELGPDEELLPALGERERGRPGRDLDAAALTDHRIPEPRIQLQHHIDIEARDEEAIFVRDRAAGQDAVGRRWAVEGRGHVVGDGSLGHGIDDADDRRDRTDAGPAVSAGGPALGRAGIDAGVRRIEAHAVALAARARRDHARQRISLRGLARPLVVEAAVLGEPPAGVQTDALGRLARVGEIDRGDDPAHRVRDERRRAAVGHEHRARLTRQRDGAHDVQIARPEHRERRAEAARHDQPITALRQRPRLDGDRHRATLLEGLAQRLVGRFEHDHAALVAQAHGHASIGEREHVPRPAGQRRDGQLVHRLHVDGVQRALVVIGDEGETLLARAHQLHRGAGPRRRGAREAARRAGGASRRGLRRRGGAR